MATIVTRQTGATSVARPLTNTELDNNFINLNTAVVSAITGPASATDNAVVRFDTTTGKLAQDSLVTVDDAGKLIATGLLSTGTSGVTISNGNTITGIVKVATGTGYTSPPTIAISAPTTVGGITATATTGLQLGSVAGIVIFGGSGYQVGDDFYVVGGTFTTQMRLRVATLSGTAVATVTSVLGGEYSVIPSTPATTTAITGTGSGCTITPIWTTSNTTTITNAGSGYVEQPTVTFSGGGGGGASAYATVGSDTTIKSLGTVLNFNTDNGTGFRVTTSGQTATNYWQALGHGTAGILRSSGATADSQIHTAGTGSLLLGTNSGFIQTRIAHTANAVNHLQLTGNSTGGAPTISGVGSDTNVSLFLLTKGTGAVEFRNDPAAAVFGIELAGNTTVDKTTFIDFHSSASTDYDFRLGRDGGVNNSVTYVNAGTGNHRFLTTSLEQFRVAHTASAVNYLQVTGGATGSGPVISAQGSDSNINLTLNVKNSAGVIINANQRDNTPFGGSANIVALGTAQGQVTSLSFKPTFVGSADMAPRRAGEISVGFTANWSSEYMNLGVGGINANDGNFIPKTVLQLTNPNSATATPAVNYFGMRGSTTGVAPVLSVAGSDTNISLVIQSKGTGALNLAAGSSGVNVSNGTTVTAITRTLAGTGYTSVPTISISAPTTAGGVQATATTFIEFVGTATVATGGTSYTLNDTLTVSGGTFNAVVTLTVTGVSAGIITSVTRLAVGQYTVLPTNPVSVTGGTGSGATFNLSWGITNTFTITNAGSGYVEQPTVTFSGGGGSGAAAYASVGSANIIKSLGSSTVSALSTASFVFQTPNTVAPAFIIREAVGADSFVMLNPQSGYTNFVALGGANANFGLFANGTGTLQLGTSGTSNIIQMQVSHTASAVNYVQVTGSATGSTPTISAQGSDTNLALQLASKNTAVISLITNGSKQFDVYGPISAANFIRAAGAVVGSAPSFTANGSDTNIDLILTPKGTGVVKTTGGLYVSEAGYSVLGGRLQITSAGSGGVINQADNSPLTFKLNSVNVLDLPYSASAVNYAQLYNSATGNAIWLKTNGTDTNIGLALQSKGTGAITLAAGSSGVNVSNGTTVTAITRTLAGSGFTSVPTVIIAAPTTLGGVQATATVPLQQISPLTIVNGGTGYTVNDTLTVSGGTWSLTPTMTVATVSGGGVITSITQVNFGVGTVIPSNPISVTGGTGTGATFSTTAWGIGFTFVITNAGSGYVEQPTVTFSGGGGSGAAAYASVGAGTIIRTLSAALDFYTPHQQIAFRVQDYAGSTGPGYWTAFGGNTNPILRAIGASGGQIQTSSAVPLQFGTAAGIEQFRVTHTASAVNYVQVAGSATGSGPVISAQGSDTNVPLNISSKNAGAIVFTRQRDAAVSNQYLFANTGGLSSDANGGAFWRGLHVTAPNYTVSAANKFPRIAQYFELDSITDPTYKNAYYAISNALGENVESIQANDTGGGWTFKNLISNSLDKSFRIAAPLTTDRNYLQVAGAAAGASPVLSAQGTDTNIGLVIQPKGTGAINLVAGSNGINVSNGTTVTGITRTAAGSGFTSVPTVIIAAPTTSGGVQATATAFMEAVGIPTVAAAGLNYQVNNVLTVSGGTFNTAVQLTVTGIGVNGTITAVTRSAAGRYSVLPTNPVSVTGGNGTGATFNISWGISSTFTITNAGSGYLEQPTLAFSGGGGSAASANAVVGSDTLVRSLGTNMAFYTPNGQIGFRVLNFEGSTGTGYWNALGGTTGPQLRATGSTSAVILTESGVPIQFLTASLEQFRVTHTASAVNYPQVTGGAVGTDPVISAQGSDANINLSLSAKGTGAVNSTTRFSAGTASTNYLQLQGGATTVAPILSAQGTDTNIDLALTPKGTGKVVVNGPIQIDSQLVVDAATITTTATTANQVLTAQDATVYRAVKFLIRAVDATSGKYHTTEILAVHNGSTANSTEYASVNIGGVCATFDVDYSASTIRLLATPATANSTVFTVALQLLK